MDAAEPDPSALPGADPDRPVPRDGAPATRVGRRLPADRLRATAPAGVVLVALVGLWQLLVSALGTDPAVVPGPWRVARATWDDRSDIWPAITTTTAEAVYGLLVAVAVAVVVGVAIDGSRTVRRSLYPLVVASQTLPIVALAPLVTIWWGFGRWPKVGLVALFTFFPITVGLVQGLRSADPDAVNLLRTMRASRLQLLLRVRFPSALGQFFTGLKIAVTYAYTMAIVAEFVGAQQGLGIYMTMAKNAAPIRTDLVFGAVVVTSLLTIALFVIVGWLERLAMPWRRPTRR